MKPKIVIIILLLIITAGCKPVATEAPVQKPATVAASTFAPVSTKTPSSSTMMSIATLTVTSQADALDFRDIKSGQYVLIEDPEKEILYIVSTNKQIVNELSLKSQLESDPGLITEFAVSDDGTQFLVMRPSPKSSVLHDVSTGNSTYLSIDQNCQSASWSPDKKTIALSCLTSDVRAEIFTLDTATGQLSQVTDCHNDNQYCYLASWSPDGRWLAYYQADERSGQHPRGIMIVDTNCFKTNNCMNEPMGLIKAESNPAWSLQNQLVYVESGILSYLEMGQLNQAHANLLPDIPDISNDRKCKTIRLSPDGNFLACTAESQTSDSVYLYSPSLNTFDLIYSSQNLSLNLIGWITIP